MSEKEHLPTNNSAVQGNPALAIAEVASHIAMPTHHGKPLTYMRFDEYGNIPMPLGELWLPHNVGLPSYIGHRDNQKGSCRSDPFPRSFERSRYGAMIFWLDAKMLKNSGGMPNYISFNAQEYIECQVNAFSAALAKKYNVQSLKSNVFFPSSDVLKKMGNTVCAAVILGASPEEGHMLQSILGPEILKYRTQLMHEMNNVANPETIYDTRGGMWRDRMMGRIDDTALTEHAIAAFIQGTPKILPYGETMLLGSNHAPTPHAHKPIARTHPDSAARALGIHGNGLALSLSLDHTFSIPRVQRSFIDASSKKPFVSDASYLQSEELKAFGLSLASRLKCELRLVYFHATSDSPHSTLLLFPNAPRHQHQAVLEKAITIIQGMQQRHEKNAHDSQNFRGQGR